MKNYQATRGKIKNLLDALKQRFSTTEWREFNPIDYCKEFNVSFILPQVLKKEGYYYNEYKDRKCYIMLSKNIMMSNEIVIHNKLREYCNKYARKSSLKKKKIKAKNVVQPKFNFNKKEKKVKVISVSVGLNFYNSVIADCKNKGISISRWMFNKLEADKNVALIEKTKNIELDKKDVLQQIPTNTKPNRRGRPIQILKDRVYNEKTIYTIESTETKIKSLETIMSLYNNGVINIQELENLKYGVMNKNK
jgi:hypothetical protein